MRSNRLRGATSLRALCLTVLALAFSGAAYADRDDDEREYEEHRDREEYGTQIRLQEAKWESGDRRLVIKGSRAGRYATVTVRDAASDLQVAEFRADRDGKFEEKIPQLSRVPCRVRAIAGDSSAERDVRRAPFDCGAPQGGDDNHDDNGNSGDDSGADETIAEHQGLIYNGPGTCLECHDQEAEDIFHSTHYQWKGDALYMTNVPPLVQGKIAGAVNTYCGSVLGNWTACSSCHIGRGALPEDASSQTQRENIDCLVCHQDAYKRVRVGDRFEPDTANMRITMDQAVQTVHKPTRDSCLQCHAKAGGGDAVKRGDLALASAVTADIHFDVHMATSGANLACQDCHTPQNHRFPGKGSDLRPTDLDQPLECANSNCHDSRPHDASDINRHTARVACQTCHIPVYAKDAADTDASEATEIDRSWQAGSDHVTPPLHPVLTKANNLTPIYLHWNRTSSNTLLGDVLSQDPTTGTYHTSVPEGWVDDPDSKLYPFKYKTSDYPMRSASRQLIALDTSVFFATADADAAARAGLSNMGFLAGFEDFDENDAYEWVTTDTFQLLNHEVSPEDDALDCRSCHFSTARMDLQGQLGYAPIAPQSTCSTDCHSASEAREWRYGSFGDFREYHREHAGEERVACSKCHGFSR